MVPSLDALATAVSTPDAVLTVIPLSLFVAAMAALTFPLSTVTALALGCVPATGGIGYALFYDPPDAVAGDRP